MSSALLERDALAAVEPAESSLDSEFEAIVAGVEAPLVSTSSTAGAAGAKKRSGANLVAHILLNLVLVVLVGLAGAVAIVPRVTGSVPLTVLSGSMRPTIQPGDLVVVRPTPVANLNVDDIVTFQPVSGVSTLVTHRIIDIVHDEQGAVINIQTQGDANNAADNLLAPEQIMGRVWYTVPRIGFLTNGRNALLMVSVLGLGLVAYATVLFLKKDDEDSDD